MSAAATFDVFSCPLEGTQLIEASAGAGKTWNLCGLHLRLLLERGLEVQRILVVTFTNAATAELRQRIRDRIVEMLAYLRDGAPAGADPFVPRLVATLRGGPGLTDDEMMARLDLALRSFDEAAIYTIHGFCQRALADAPFVAQLPLTLEGVQDDAEFFSDAVNDFWRQRIAGDSLDPALAAHLAERKDSPQKFARLLRRHVAKPLSLALWPHDMADPGTVDVAALTAAHANARSLWDGQRDAIVAQLLSALPALHGGTYKPDSVRAAAAGWDRLLAGSDALAALPSTPAKVDLLGASKLQPKKGHRAPLHPFFTAAQHLLDLRAAAAQTLALTRLSLLRQMLDEAGWALREAKRRKRVVAYDDMLFNLHARLTGRDARWLTESLKARFPAALIDEFQDTDPLQFDIFKTIYGRGDATLFLVGDPKQAIYSFRNADLPTYLQARAQATAEYTLVENQRASAPLIAALNALFGANSQAFMLPGLRYHPVGLGAKPRPRFVDRTLERAPLQVWALPGDAANGQGLLVKGDALAAAAAATAGEIARLIGAARGGQITLAGEPMRAADIAVLVRSHGQGAAMREALAALGVGSVELSQASVYASQDAWEVECLLAAILEPTQDGVLTAALATELLGLDAAAIAALAMDETQLVGWVQRFAACREVWIARGVGFMLRELIRGEHVAERLLVRADGERRLTNLLHLAECLHQAAETHAAPDALLRWFQTQRRDDRANDASQLRLESDQNLVQIVTIHRAKGLEYPVVFCPFLWLGQRGGPGTGLDGVEYHDDAGRSVIDYRQGQDDFDEADVKRRLRLESAAEDLRLIYVALTRAMHRCVIVAGAYLTRSFGSVSAKESTRSLLNWLVAGEGLTPQTWFDGERDTAAIAAAWAVLAAKAGPAIDIAPLPQAPPTPLPAQQPDPDTLAALPAPRCIAPAWWIGSYSALSHGATRADAADHDLRSAAPRPAARLDDDDILRFPRGAAAGECIHAVFERADFTDRASWPPAIADALRIHGPTLAATAAIDAATETLRARMLHRMLGDVLAAPLPVATTRPLCLARVPRQRRLTELEFHLPAPELEADALNTALAELGYAVPRLAFGALRGYLKGFIDLVVEHDGRYFIVDWKSNHLGDTPADYGDAALAATMATQSYHLQALLYSAALDRLLQRRLPGYAAAQHFGGVLYLFVRGVRPGWANERGTPAGMHFHRPSPQALRRVSALLGHSEAGA